MTVVIFALLIFFSLIEWIIIIDVILSWLVLFRINFRPRFIQSITIPMYEHVRRYIPSTFAGIDFAPLIIFIAIEFITKLLITLDPSVIGYLSR